MLISVETARNEYMYTQLNLYCLQKPQYCHWHWKNLVSKYIKYEQVDNCGLEASNKVALNSPEDTQKYLRPEN